MPILLVLALAAIGAAQPAPEPGFEGRLAAQCRAAGAEPQFTEARFDGQTRSFTFQCGSELKMQFALAPATGEPRFIALNVRDAKPDTLDVVARGSCALEGVTVLHMGDQSRALLCEHGDRRLLVSVHRNGPDLVAVGAEIRR